MTLRSALLGCIVALSAPAAFAQDEKSPGEDTCPTPTGDTKTIPMPAAGGGSTTSNTASTSTSTGGSDGLVSGRNTGKIDFAKHGAKVKVEGGMMPRTGDLSISNRSTAAQPSAAPAKRPARRGGR